MSVIRLPDTMSRWPFPRRMNPFYPEVAEESASWLRSFHAFSPAAQRAFDRCEFGKSTAALVLSMNFAGGDLSDDTEASDIAGLLTALANPTLSRG